MAPKNDPRREVGTTVIAKATAVTSEAECKRLFGTFWKTATVTGVVKIVVIPPRGSGKQTSVVVEWKIQDRIKLKEVKLVNVKLPEQGQQPGNGASAEATPISAQNGGGRSSTVPATRGISTVKMQTDQNSAIGTQFAERVTTHGVDWLESDISEPLNGFVTRKFWTVTHFTGNRIAENQGATGLTPYDFFMWMFPVSHLQKIVSMTNTNLEVQGKQPTSCGEILRFFGLLIMMTRHEYGNRRNLWNTTNKYKYIAAPNFTRIMPRHRFESLRHCIRFSSCPEGDGDGTNRWSLVDDFVTAINEHKQMFVTPSDLLCVDESMSR